MGLIEGKVALITGAAQGVGRGIAEAFAAEGALLMLSDIQVDLVESVAAAIVAQGGRAVAMHADVTRPEDVQANVDETVRQFGGLDILVNNAQSVTVAVSINDTSDAQFADMFVSGALGTFRYMKAAYPHLKARGGGCIVNFASGSAKRWDMSGYGPYSAVKQAIRALTRAAANEWGRDGIRVNAIAPLANSPALDRWQDLDPDLASQIVSQIPMGRYGDPVTDIGRAVLFLVGPDASYISGMTMPLDGGMANFD